MSFTVLEGLKGIPKTAALSVVSTRAAIQEDLCICSNCKTCTFFIYIVFCFLHLVLSRDL